ncbi:MAG: cupredoxin domain-containing protein [Minisyncoccota bacterium]
MKKFISIVVFIIVVIGAYIFWPGTKKQINQVPAPAMMQINKPQEFAMTAYYDETGVWYSLKEIRVKQGDTVRITITNTKGMHDFTLDEYSIYQELPLNQDTIIEFTADKKGEFVYYCSKPGHRAKGQFGALIVE